MRKNPNTNLTAPAQSPAPDSKRMILNSICEYLEKSGFSKSVKKLRAEAKIEAESEEGGLLDLEALCNEQLKICLTADDNKEKGEGKKEKKKKKEISDVHQLGITLEETDIAIEEKVAKLKGKRKKEEAPVDDNLSAKEPKTTAKEKHSKKSKLQEDKTEDKKSLEKDKVSSEQVAGEAEKDAALISEGKKQKKKNKENDAPDGSEVESKERRTEEARLAVVEGKEQTRGPTLVACSENGDSARSAKQSKSKSKRKKEESPVQENSVANTTALAKEEPNKVDPPNSEAQMDEKRASNKRKKISEGNGNGHILEKQENDSIEEVKKSKQHKNMPLSENADDKVGKGEGEHDKISQTKEEKGKASPPNLQTPSSKETDVILDKNGGEKSSQKNSVKQRSGSAEPRTLNAFQRVKPEEVDFIDERLQDNSYWAKDGADSGYGAKAQEILGQVKGRDFRHEKTKKKRGSYRGGQIDVQSHSVKFNYSDEE